MPAQDEGCAVLDPQGGVGTRHEPLAGGLLVPRSAVDLSRQKEPRHVAHGERVRQLTGLHEVVLDRVAVAHEDGLFEPGDGVHEGFLHRRGEGSGDPVHVDHIRLQPLGLDEDLVAVAVGEAHDLVFDRWAVARPHPLDTTRVHRREVQILRDDRVRGGGGVGDVAGNLPQDGKGRLGSELAEGDGALVAPLLLEDFPVQAVPVQARGRSRLQP